MKITDTDTLIQTESTYYSYSRYLPFYRRLRLRHTQELLASSFGLLLRYSLIFVCILVYLAIAYRVAPLVLFTVFCSFLLVGSLLIVVGTVLGIRVRRPYCVKCHKWVTVHDPMLGIPVTENTLADAKNSDIGKSLFNRDWSALRCAEQLHSWPGQPAIYIALGCCETCDGPFSVFVDVHGANNKKELFTGTIFSMEIDKPCTLDLLETAVERNLIANEDMYSKAVCFCKALGSLKDFDLVALVRQRKEKAQAFGRRGMTALSNGKLDEAEENLNSALQIFEELGERKVQAITYMNLANVYYRREALDQAETLLERSLGLYDELHDKLEMAVDYGFLGTIQFDRKEFDRAEQFFCKALEIDTTLGNKFGMATDYHALGLIHKALDKREQARDAFAEALKLCKELGDKASAKAMQTELDGLDR